MDWQEPIGCGGVAVFPDDVIMVDDDGAVVIPQKLVADVAAVAADQERMEEWIMTQVNDGAPLPGLYPPNAEEQGPLRGLAEGRGSLCEHRFPGCDIEGEHRLV